MLLTVACSTEPDDEIHDLQAHIVYVNETGDENNLDVDTYDGYWQWNSEKFEKAALSILPFGIQLSKLPCSALVRYALPEDYWEEATKTIEYEPIILFTKLYANSSTTDYYNSMAATCAFTVTYGGRQHIISFEVGPGSQYYYDRAHELAYVLLYPRQIAVDDNKISRPDVEEALKFTPVPFCKPFNPQVLRLRADLQELPHRSAYGRR